MSICIIGIFLTGDFVHAKRRSRSPASPSFTEDHYKSFSLIARTWNAKGCEREIPRKTKNAIEKACHGARSQGMLYRPQTRSVAKGSHVQCVLTSELGFLEISFGQKSRRKFIPNQGLAEFKLDPKGEIYAIAQDGHAVGAGYCGELEEEVSTRKSIMGYGTFQSLFINQYSPGKKLSADEFFGQIAKVNLCFQHHPGFVPYRCAKFYAKNKNYKRMPASRKSKRRTKYNYEYF